MPLTVGSLFTGIGGIDLGLEAAGMTVRWQAEIDPYCRRILAKRWPGIPNLGDVSQIDWENDGLDFGDGTARSLHVDLLCGGFPCQPVSLAGAQRGMDDDRWLWPEFVRAIRSLRPRWVVAENVPGILGSEFGGVLGDLASLGFDADWESIPAAAVGAPHLRYRVFLVAWPVADPGRGRLEKHGGSRPTPAEQPVVECGGALADADGGRRQEQRLEEPGGLEGPQGGVADRCGEVREQRDVSALPDPEGFSFRRRLCESWAERERWGRPRHSDQPTGGRWIAEPDVGRVATRVSRRVDRLRCLGNAVVPPVAQWVGEAIAGHDRGEALCR